MRFLAILLPIALAAPMLAQRAPAVPPVTLRSAWTAIALPAAPLGIMESGGTLWVCGDHEMVAASRDGGRSWSILNIMHGGEMLFALAKLAPQHLAAFGTGGVWLDSTDAGATWQRKFFSARFESLTQVAFADALNGFGFNGDQLAVTHDGGEKWTFFANTSGPMADRPQAVAVRDAGHAVVLFRRDDGLSGTFATSDGGATWPARTFPKQWLWSGIRVEAGLFRLEGDQDITLAQNQPVAALSSDGLAWTTTPETQSHIFACQVQGCLMDGGWMDFSAGVTLRGLPDAATWIGSRWAAAADSFCELGAQLLCRTGNEAWQAPPPLPPLPVKTGGTVITMKCRHCPKPDYPPSARRQHIEGTVRLHAQIGTDGRIQGLVLISAPAAVLARAAMDAVRKWKYSPLQLYGVRQPVDTEITVLFQRN